VLFVWLGGVFRGALILKLNMSAPIVLLYFSNHLIILQG